MPKKKRISYKVGEYDRERGGYPVFLEPFAFYRVVGYFICEDDADYIAAHMTEQLWKYNTTDKGKWNGITHYE